MIIRLHVNLSPDQKDSKKINHKANMSAPNDNQIAAAKKDQSIQVNSELKSYYESWDSRIVYQVIMGGTQHFGYWDKDTYFPFPLTPQLRR